MREAGSMSERIALFCCASLSRFATRASINSWPGGSCVSPSKRDHAVRRSMFWLLVR